MVQKYIEMSKFVDMSYHSLILDFALFKDLFIFSPFQDFFSGTHRVWSHTVFAPLLIMLLSGPIAKLKPSKKNIQRNLRLFRLGCENIF